MDIAEIEPETRSSCERALVRGHRAQGPEIALEGELDVEGALVLDEWNDDAHAAFERGQPIVVRADTPEMKRRSRVPRWPVLVRDPSCSSSTSSS